MADGKTMNVKFSAGIMVIEKEVWLSRLLEILSDRHMAAYEIECELADRRYGKYCISSYTIARYLKEMADKGAIQTEMQWSRGNIHRRFYWKNNGGDHK